MSDLNVNVDDIEEGFPVVPIGIYSAVVEKIDFAVDRDDPSLRRTDKNGDEYLQVEFKLMDGEGAGAHVFVNYLHPMKAKFKELCTALGKFGNVATTEEMIGAGCRLTIGQETYEGNLKNTVKGYLR